MTIRSLAARGLSFAHLAGLNRKSAKAEGDEPEDDDTKDAKGRAEGDDPDDQNRDSGNSKKGQRAEDDDDDVNAEDDTPDDEDKPTGKGAKGSKADDEEAEDDDEADDREEEMRGKSAVASARRREQARCAAIMGSKAAGRNVALAASLAFNTRMTRQEAISVLQSTPAASTNTGRSSRNPALGAGGEVSPNSKVAIQSSWDRAMQRANPSRSK